MPTFYDSHNNAHELSERIGSGGEGTVFQCGDFNLVAKIYHEPISADKAEKLRWMAAHKNERLLKVAAWVVDVLTDAPDGRVVGFLMPNVKAKEIHELYSLKSRRVYFPEATWHFLIHTAANLARAFHNLHRDAHVMGDVNHGNCVVMRDGTVKLIDCDSYSIKTGERRYACEVGVATHLAPELQGVNLSRIERENKHDNFGLAVIIFQLLFLGRHPFAGNYLGAEDKSLEDCIREFRFAYGSNAALKNVRQPPGTLQLAAVSPRVAAMFEQAFLIEDRPEPREWIEALEDLAQNLEQCSLHPGHLYFNELAACPWCEIETQTGLMLFPFITSGSHLNGEKPFNIFTVENLIASLGIENNLPVKLPAATPNLTLPPPSPEIVEARQNRLKTNFFILPAYFLGLILLMWLLGFGWTFCLGIFFMTILIGFLNTHYQSVRQPLEEILKDTELKLENHKFKSAHGVPQILNEDLAKIRKKVADYQSVQQKSINELKLLQTEVSRRELYNYLHSKTVSDAPIAEISERERERLNAVGIKTAAEIEENRLRHFYKINENLISPLLEWRADLKTDFERGKLAADPIKAEQTRFIKETDSERRQIERDIEQLLILLRGGAAHLQNQRHQLSVKSRELTKQIAQLKSDLHNLGSNFPATIALVLLTIFTPMFGIVTGLTATDNPINPPPLSRRLSGDNYGTATTAGIYPARALYLPDMNITDAEIEDLSDFERKQYAENLYNEAIKYNYGDTVDNYAKIYVDRLKAEQYSRLAVRFNAKDSHNLNQLGYALYGQGKYQESLKYLNRSLQLDQNNSETKIFISMNQLATKGYGESVKLMKELTEKYSNSFEGFYNLGLAYIGQGNYTKAEAAFRRATEIKPSDADAHYELGYCLYKLKKKTDLQIEHATLMTIDPNLAEKLRVDTKNNIEINVIQSVDVNTNE